MVAWYKAEHPHKPQKRNIWGHTFFLISVNEGDDPDEKALAIAKSKEQEYISATNELVRWTLQEIESVLELIDQDIEDGTEVYWELKQRVDKK